jgi:trk system potassium uptake protein TrkA
MPEMAVIGMGRFGRAVAHNLGREGAAVLAIDRDGRRLEAVAADVEATAVADTTDEEQVAALDLERMACVVVAIGSRATEASLLTTAILRERGVPRIVARAFDERHARLLLAVGAHEVLNPEDEVGGRLALHLATPDVDDQIRLGGAMVATVVAPEAFAGKTFGELALPERYGVRPLALFRGGSWDVAVEPGVGVESGDVLVLLGDRDAVLGVAALL